MLTAEKFHGGSLVTTETTVDLTFASPRVIALKAEDDIAVTLPDCTDHIFQPNDVGRPRFIIINDTADDATISNQSGVIKTLEPQTVGEVHLLDPEQDEWFVAVYPLNAARALAKGPGLNPALDLTAPAALDPFCFLGDDCEYADAEPLDGQDDRPLVVVPMFHDCKQFAHNTTREPIRAADVVMPNRIPFRIRPGEFVKDVAHPSGGITLPDSFWELFEYKGNPRLLVYDGAAHGVSRNPYHVRGFGVGSPFGWALGDGVSDFEVRRHIWKHQETYDVSGTEFTIEFRLVAEHTVNPEPLLTPRGSIPGVIGAVWDGSTLTITFSRPMDTNETGGGFGWKLHLAGSDDRTSFQTRTWVDARTLQISNAIATGSVGQDMTLDYVAASDSIRDAAGTPLPSFVGLPVDVSGETPWSVNNPDAGMWGTLFMFYAFCNQLAPSFADGNTHTPTGFSAANAFTRDDPLIWGSAFGVSGGSDELKGAHPHLLFAAALATSWHDPILSAHVPLDERRHLLAADGSGARGRNRVFGYKRPNCSPWVPNPLADQDYCRTCFSNDTEGVLGTVLFGTAGRMAAMTWGGDFPISRPNEHLCFENGLATGVTYLIPANPGWDEDVGRRTETSSASISICIPEEGDPGYADWPFYQFDSCRGHPDEPFEEIGGSHRCFKNTESIQPTRCCVVTYDEDAVHWHDSHSTTSTVLLGARDACVRQIESYGPRDPFTNLCEVVGLECRVIKTYWTQYVGFLADYSYWMGANQALRSIRWSRHVSDPDQVFFSYVYDETDTDDLTQHVGTFTLGASIAVATVDTDEAATAVLLYDPALADYEDMSISGRAKTGGSDIPHGLVVRGSIDLGSDLTGYLGLIRRTGVSTGAAEIFYYDDGTPTLLASENFEMDADDVDLTFEAWGHQVSLSYAVVGGSQASGVLTVETCHRESGGYAGLATTGDDAGMEFENVVIVDTTKQLLEVYGEMRPSAMEIQFPSGAKESYGKCDVWHNPNCGSEKCYCRSWTDSLREQTSVTTDGEVTAETNPTIVGASFPDECVEVWCGGDLSCGDCPAPFVCLSMTIPKRCVPSNESEPDMCQGIWLHCNQGVDCN